MLTRTVRREQRVGKQPATGRNERRGAGQRYDGLNPHGRLGRRKGRHELRHLYFRRYGQCPAILQAGNRPHGTRKNRRDAQLPHRQRADRTSDLRTEACLRAGQCRQQRHASATRHARRSDRKYSGHGARRLPQRCRRDPPGCQDPGSPLRHGRHDLHRQRRQCPCAGMPGPYRHQDIASQHVPRADRPLGCLRLGSLGERLSFCQDHFGRPADRRLSRSSRPHPRRGGRSFLPAAGNSQPNGRHGERHPLGNRFYMQNHACQHPLRRLRLQTDAP